MIPMIFNEDYKNKDDEKSLYELLYINETNVSRPGEKNHYQE